MPDIANKVEGLAKKYLLRQQQGRSRYKSLREVLTEKTKSLASLGRRNVQPSGTGEEFWALKDVSFEIKQGEAVGTIAGMGLANRRCSSCSATSPSRSRGVSRLKASRV